MIAVTEKLAWYVSRASGLIAFLLVAASILWGLTLSSRLVRRRGVPAWLLDLHKYLGTLSIVFTAVHLLGLVADNYVHFGWKELFVPMGSRWRPGAVAWGIVAFYLLVAIQVTSWVMRKLPRKVWHAVHLLSFPLFVMGAIHGFTAGADAGSRLVQWTALVVGNLVVLLATFRALTFTPRRSKQRAAAPPVTAPAPEPLAAAAPMPGTAADKVAAAKARVAAAKAAAAAKPAAAADSHDAAADSHDAAAIARELSAFAPAPGERRALVLPQPPAAAPAPPADVFAVPPSGAPVELLRSR